MKMYHGTTKEMWNEIQKEGVLWGRKNQYWCGRKMDRITYLATSRKHAGIYNDRGITRKPCVVLEVNMPNVESCDYWEFVTYDPISLDRIKVLCDII